MTQHKFDIPPLNDIHLLPNAKIKIIVIFKNIKIPEYNKWTYFPFKFGEHKVCTVSLKAHTVCLPLYVCALFVTPCFTITI